VLLVTGAAGALLRGTATLPPAALLLGLGAGATYALYTMFSKVATERYGPALAVLVVRLRAARARPSPRRRTPFLRAPQHALLLLALGIVPTLLPYALYLRRLRELRASTAPCSHRLEPVIAALLALTTGVATPAASP
jgi:drug/metabolite transporter, DME family